MKKTIKKFSHISLIASVCSIIFGLSLAVNPEAVITYISTMIGLITIITGITKLVQYHKNNSNSTFIMSGAITTIILGLVILFLTNKIIEFLNVLIAIWILFTGISNLIKTLQWNDKTSRLWLTSLIFAIAVIIAGIYILCSTTAVTSMIGFLIAAYGVLDLISNVIFIKNTDNVVVVTEVVS